MDANAKVGKTVIKDDPNNVSGNGQLLLDIIDRQNLELLNCSDLCDGVITRNRITKDSTEISVLDYIICCEKLAVFLESMLIDEKRNFPLTKYASRKGNQKIVVSDHNT